MHLPLPVGYVLDNKYRISTHMSHGSDHNLYSVTDIKSGKRLILSEFIPEYCERNDIKEVVCRSTLEAGFNDSVNKVESDAKTILETDLNKNYFLTEYIRTLNTVYMLSSAEDVPAVMSIAEIRVMSFDERCKLFINLLDFSVLSLSYAVYCLPDVSNTGVLHDNFIISYALSPQRDKLAVLFALCTIFYFFQFGSYYSPESRDIERVSSKQKKPVLLQILKGLDGSFMGDVTDFRDEFVKVYEASKTDQEKLKENKKERKKERKKKEEKAEKIEKREKIKKENIVIKNKLAMLISLIILFLAITAVSFLSMQIFFKNNPASTTPPTIEPTKKPAKIIRQMDETLYIEGEMI